MHSSKLGRNEMNTYLKVSSAKIFADCGSACPKTFLVGGVRTSLEQKFTKASIGPPSARPRHPLDKGLALFFFVPPIYV